ncbi:MAG: NFACT family protein [Clostridiales bacterium]|nr:NFACT family protein [Clostridiales bacterium]MBS5877200.1 NFACT family protein [Clostridiales bacterium]
MAFDGFTLSALRHEFADLLTGGRIYKIAQPEPDELLLTIKTNSGTFRLLISANASYPIIYLTNENKPSPMTAPGFCMLLRKHLQNGRILSITQPRLERMIDIEVEHMDEMGDMRPRHLIAEFMGKHSNIILTNEEYTILDGMKRIPSQVSSVREVLPGRPYFIPDSDNKLDPLTVTKEDFYNRVFSCPGPIYKALYSSITGLSPLLSNEICERADFDPDRPAASLSSAEKEKIFNAFSEMVNEVKNGNYIFAIYRDGDRLEFSAIDLKYRPKGTVYDSPSRMFIDYYSGKEARASMRNKSSDLRKLVSTYLDRSLKKLSIQENDIDRTQNRDKYRVYGELLQAFGYGAKDGDKDITVNNYYDENKPVTIPLKPDMTAMENARAYFRKYNKLKRTFEAASKMVEETRSEVMHLESISTSLDIADSEDDLTQIKDELINLGYIHAKTNERRKKTQSRPLKFMSSDGYEILVGKNNFQNEELTFKIARPDDWWFHAKGTVGSHVILRTNGEEPADKAFEEAAALAARFSKNGNLDKVEVDYIRKKEIKKPPASKPGFVIYNTNYSLIASTDISGIKEIKD